MKTEFTKQLPLENRVVLLTGAAGYLGSALTCGLAGAGAQLVLTSRNEARLKLLQGELSKVGYSVSAMPVDLTDEAGRAAVLDHVKARHGRLDVLVNNAHAGRAATVASAKAEDFAGAAELGVTIPFLMVQQALPLLCKSIAEGGASVVNMASMYGSVSPDGRLYGDSGQNNPPFYGAAKAGMIQLTRYLACHLAERKIRVNAVSPGSFPQPSVDADFQARLSDRVPLGRVGMPAELVGPVVFLASDASSYVTGINLPVDGGWTAW